MRSISDLRWTLSFGPGAFPQVVKVGMQLPNLEPGWPCMEDKAEGDEGGACGCEDAEVSKSEVGVVVTFGATLDMNEDRLSGNELNRCFSRDKF